MNKEVIRFIQYIEDNSHLKHGIVRMSTQDFFHFSKTLGFSFSIDDFVSTMRENDNRHQSTVKLGGKGLNRISIGKSVDISLMTLELYRNFYV